MNTLFNVWVIPVKHKMISKKLNIINPPYVPIATGVEEKLLPRYREMFDAQTVITDIGPSVKFMLTGDGERRLARDCKVYEEMDGSLVLVLLESLSKGGQMYRCCNEFEPVGSICGYEWKNA